MVVRSLPPTAAQRVALADPAIAHDLSGVVALLGKEGVVVSDTSARWGGIECLRFSRPTALHADAILLVVRECTPATAASATVIPGLRLATSAEVQDDLKILKDIAHARKRKSGRRGRPEMPTRTVYGLGIYGRGAAAGQDWYEVDIAHPTKTLNERYLKFLDPPPLRRTPKPTAAGRAAAGADTSSGGGGAGADSAAGSGGGGGPPKCASHPAGGDHWVLLGRHPCAKCKHAVCRKCREDAHEGAFMGQPGPKAVYVGPCKCGTNKGPPAPSSVPHTSAIEAAGDAAAAQAREALATAAAAAPVTGVVPVPVVPSSRAGRAEAAARAAQSRLLAAGTAIVPDTTTSRHQARGGAGTSRNSPTTMAAVRRLAAAPSLPDAPASPPPAAAGARPSGEAPGSALRRPVVSALPPARPVGAAAGAAAAGAAAAASAAAASVIAVPSLIAVPSRSPAGSSSSRPASIASTSASRVRRMGDGRRRGRVPAAASAAGIAAAAAADEFLDPFRIDVDFDSPPAAGGRVRPAPWPTRALIRGGVYTWVQCFERSRSYFQAEGVPGVGPWVVPPLLSPNIYSAAFPHKIQPLLRRMVRVHPTPDVDQGRRRRRRSPSGTPSDHRRRVVADAERSGARGRRSVPVRAGRSPTPPPSRDRTPSAFRAPSSGSSSASASASASGSSDDDADGTSPVRRRIDGGRTSASVDRAPAGGMGPLDGYPPIPSAHTFEVLTFEYDGGTQTAITAIRDALMPPEADALTIMSGMIPDDDSFPMDNQLTLSRGITSSDPRWGLIIRHLPMLLSTAHSDFVDIDFKAFGIEVVLVYHVKENGEGAASLSNRRNAQAVDRDIDVHFNLLVGTGVPFLRFTAGNDVVDVENDKAFDILGGLLNHNVILGCHAWGPDPRALRTHGVRGGKPTDNRWGLSAAELVVYLSRKKVPAIPAQKTKLAGLPPSSAPVIDLVFKKNAAAVKPRDNVADFFVTNRGLLADGQRLWVQLELRESINRHTAPRATLLITATSVSVAIHPTAAPGDIVLLVRYWMTENPVVTVWQRRAAPAPKPRHRSSDAGDSSSDSPVACGGAGPARRGGRGGAGKRRGPALRCGGAARGLGGGVGLGLGLGEHHGLGGLGDGLDGGDLGAMGGVDDAGGGGIGGGGGLGTSGGGGTVGSGGGGGVDAAAASQSAKAAADAAAAASAAASTSANALSINTSQTISDLREDLKKARDELSTLRDNHDVSKASMTEQHNAVVTQLRNDHDKTIAAMRSEHDAALTKLRADHETAMQKLRDENAAAIDRIQVRADAASQAAASMRGHLRVLLPVMRSAMAGQERAQVAAERERALEREERAATADRALQGSSMVMTSMLAMSGKTVPERSLQIPSVPGVHRASFPADSVASTRIHPQSGQPRGVPPSVAAASGSDGDTGAGGGSGGASDSDAGGLTAEIANALSGLSSILGRGDTTE